MNKKIIFSGLVVIAIVSVITFSNNLDVRSNNLSDTTLANIEALAAGESGAKCPNGCKDIAWGTHKILECDCNYDHFSSCSSWNC